jgi:hypothetical protein
VKYVIRGLDRRGKIMFYTGRAGIDLSCHLKNAFRYDSQAAALRKVKQFNEMEPVHGYWFIASKVLERV